MKQTIIGSNKPDLFVKRTTFKPFQYPEVNAYKDAINHSYWLVSEWNFMSDIQDFNTRLTPQEQQIIKRTLLAISQVEVAVKRFWTKLGDHFPKPEFEQIGVTFGECHADGTEVLTPYGWVDFKDIVEGDLVMQYHENNTLTVGPVRNKINRQYEGPMYQLSKKTADALITPGHRMCLYDQNNKYLFREIQDLVMTNTSLKIPEAAQIVGGDQLSLTPKERLQIALQADGNRRFYDSGYGKNTRKGNGLGAEYEIRVSKERKVLRMDWLIETLTKEESVHITKSPSPSRPGMFIYTVRIDNQFDYKTFDWVDLIDKNVEWCLDFVNELSHWDGESLPNKKDCQIKFTSTEESVADKAQAIGVAAGYRTNKSTYIDNRKASYKDLHVISFTQNRERVTLPPMKKSMVDYNGIVRCITVDSGAIVTRYNGKTLISGNCEVRHAEAYSHLLEVLDLNDEFAALADVPAIQGRIDYLEKYLNKGTEPIDYIMTLALFSIFVENISLFSQFAIIKSFNKHQNLLKDIDNVVQATQKEELVHAEFGMYLINLLREQVPDWFDDKFYAKLEQACSKAFEAECAILDWIFESGDVQHVSKDELRNFIAARFNKSLKNIGAKQIFIIDNQLLSNLSWFEEEVYAPTHSDFFYKKPVTYSKKVQSINAEDIF